MARLARMVFASADPEVLASFWAGAFGWERISPGVISGPETVGPIVFRKAPKTPTIEVPVHLDVNVPDRERTVERLLDLGARVVVTTTHAVGEIRETFTVLRDPEGNGFCVQAPGGHDEPYVGNVTFAASDPGALADFWVAALAYERAPLDAELARKLLDGGLDPAELDAYVAVVHPEGMRPRLLFQRRQKTSAPDPPLHLDLVDGDADAEIDRLVALGARRAGTSHDGHVGLEDLEGNRFCLGRA